MDLQVSIGNFQGNPVPNNCTSPNKTSGSIEDLCTMESRRCALLYYDGTIKNSPVKVFINYGAVGNFISKQLVHHLDLALTPVSEVLIKFANDTTDRSNKAVIGASLNISPYHERLNLRMVNLLSQDVILSKPWLDNWNPDINWLENTLTISTENKQYILRPEGTHDILFNRSPKKAQQILCIDQEHA